MLSDEQLIAAYTAGGAGQSMSPTFSGSGLSGLRAVEAAVRADQIEKDAGMAERRAGSMPINSSRSDTAWANWKTGTQLAAAIRAQLEGTTDGA